MRIATRQISRLPTEAPLYVPVSGGSLAAFALSLCLHAGLLYAFAASRLPAIEPARLVRVVLLGGGGDGTAAAAAGQGARETAPALPPAAREENIIRQAPVAPQKRKPVRHPARQAKPRPQARPEPQVGEAPSTLAAAQDARAAVEPAAAADGDVASASSTTTQGRAGVAADGGVAGFGGASGGASGGAGGGPGTGGGGAGGDARVFCLYCPEPAYPMIARARGWEGTVDVLLSFEADGSVGAAELRRSSGHEVLDRAAVAAARRSRFRLPAGSATVARMEYRFALEGAE